MSAQIKQPGSLTTAEEVLNLKSQIQTLAKGMKDLGTISAEHESLLNKAWEATLQLQDYVGQDAATIEDMEERLTAMEKLCVAAHDNLSEIKEAVDKMSTESSKQDEELYSLFGIEAPPSKWKKIAMIVAGALATIGAVYVGYKYFMGNSEDENKEIAPGIVQI